MPARVQFFRLVFVLGVKQADLKDTAVFTGATVATLGPKPSYFSWQLGEERPFNEGTP